MKTKLLIILALMTVMLSNAFATNATGKITAIIVGRMYREVLIGLDSKPTNACQKHHTSYQYGFHLDGRPDAKALLATILAAKTSGQPIGIVGDVVCNLDAPDNDVEQIGYIGF